MIEYLRCLLECINEKDYLLGTIDFRKELISVYDYRESPYNLICVVRTNDNQHISAEYIDKYVQAGWKTKIRKYYSIYSFIKDIKRVINIEEDKCDMPCCENHGGFTTWRNEYQKERDKFDIKDVIFNNPATIVLWEDGTKTVVKAENEEFDPEKGLAMAIAKKALGNNYDYYDVFKKYVGRYEKKQKKG